MQRISVDLPEPEGPQMTMRSPARTSRSTSVNTWKWPYHLLTFSMRMMGSVMTGEPQFAGNAGRSVCSHFL